jgi:hypothetical protein
MENLISLQISNLQTSYMHPREKLGLKSEIGSDLK